MTKQKRTFNVEINRAWCKRCGICVAFCPAKVLEETDRSEPVIANPDQCTGCQACVIRCPDFAVTVEELESESADGDTDARAG